MDFLKELFRFIRVRKIFWLVPLIIILAMLGLIIAVSGTSALAPLIYSLF